MSDSGDLEVLEWINEYIQKIMSEKEFACGHKRDGLRGFRDWLQETGKLECGDSSSTVKGDSQSLSNGGEPPTPSEHELPEMPTLLLAKQEPDGEIISTSEDGETWTGLIPSEEAEEIKLVRLSDAEEREKVLNARWANRLENAVKQERQRIRRKLEEIDAQYQSGDNVKQMLMDEVLRGEAENQEHDSLEGN